jgi:hypothetical protein
LRLFSYKNEIIGVTSEDFEVWSEFFCILHILERKWECNGSLHRIFTDFVDYDPGKTEMLYNVLSYLSMEIIYNIC